MFTNAWNMVVRWLIITMEILIAYAPGYGQGVGLDVFGVQTHPFRGPGFLVTLDTLEHATTLQDVHFRYKSSWVDKYLSVEVSSSHCNQSAIAHGENDTLTTEQLEIFYAGDTNCLVDVKVNYIPKNNLKYNPPRVMNFSMRVVPVYEAKFEGGPAALKTYLQQQIFEAMPIKKIEAIRFVRIKFTITSHGEPSQLKIVQSSGNEVADELFVKTLSEMPKWEPARDIEGTPIDQEFEFTFGSDLLLCDYIY